MTRWNSLSKDSILRKGSEAASPKTALCGCQFSLPCLTYSWWPWYYTGFLKLKALHETGMGFQMGRMVTKVWLYLSWLIFFFF